MAKPIIKADSIEGLLDVIDNGNKKDTFRNIEKMLDEHGSLHIETDQYLYYISKVAKDTSKEVYIDKTDKTTQEKSDAKKITRKKDNLDVEKTRR